MFHSELSISDWEEETVWMLLRKHECRRTQHRAFSTTINLMSPLQQFMFWWNFSPACNDLVPAASEKSYLHRTQQLLKLQLSSVHVSLYTSTLCIYNSLRESVLYDEAFKILKAFFILLSIIEFIYELINPSHFVQIQHDIFLFLFLMFCCKEIANFC